jgi:endonuclease YncB( thermonuclease family)
MRRFSNRPVMDARMGGEPLFPSEGAVLRAALAAALLTTLIALPILAADTVADRAGPAAEPPLRLQAAVLVDPAAEDAGPRMAPAKDTARVPTHGTATVGLASVGAAWSPLTTASLSTVVASERRLERVTVGAGLTLAAAGITASLADLVAPADGDMCRRLDGHTVRCIDRAESYLALITRGRPIECRFTEQQAEGARPARCTVGGADLAEQVVRQGWARANTGAEARIASAEAAARKQRIGIWQDQPSP